MRRIRGYFRNRLVVVEEVALSLSRPLVVTREGILETIGTGLFMEVAPGLVVVLWSSTRQVSAFPGPQMESKGQLNITTSLLTMDYFIFPSG